MDTSANTSLSNLLNDPAILSGWNKSELPNDDFSVDNATIMHKSDKYTLAIDPNMQASNFLRKKIELIDNKKPVKLSNVITNYDLEIKNLKIALKHGNCVMIENFQEPINPLIKPLVLNKTYKKGNSTMVLIEEEEIEVNKDFQIYLLNPNPRPI